MLIKKWRNAARLLSLVIVENFILDLMNGSKLTVPVLLKNFGGTKGMLLVTDFQIIFQVEEHIPWPDYGYSTLSAENTSVTDPESFKEMLKDWCWSGLEAEKPGWMRD